VFVPLLALVLRRRQHVAHATSLVAIMLPAAVAAELIRLNPARVVVLGGPGAISDSVVAAVRLLWD